MDNFDYKCFYRRTNSVLINEEISAKAKLHTSYFGKIVENVFKHMGAVYQAPLNENDISDSKTISYLFYKYNYIKPIFTLFGDNETIPIQDFINNTLLDPSNGHKNKFSFFIGDVGVGKTSVINYIITHHELFKLDVNNWFVRLDIDKTILEHYFPPAHIINSFVEKVCRVIISNPLVFPLEKLKEQLEDLQSYYIDSYKFEKLQFEEQNRIHNIQKVKIKDFINHIQNTFGKKLFIIFDNIDILFYHSEHKNESIENETLNFITGLVELFLHDKDILGSLGANLLLVMRTDTYLYLKSFGRTSGPLFTNDPYTVKEPLWKQVIDVRYDLLKAIVKKDPKFPDKLDVDFEVNRIYTLLMENDVAYDKLINHIRKLTNNGLRELIEYFRNYGWISEMENASITRFNSQFHIGIISFILNNRRLYTQINSLVPNLYLNCYIPSVKIDEIPFQHSNTYWLKYYILQYALNCNILNEGISEQQIFDIFSNSENSYHPRLVKEIIEVLCDPNRFNIFRRTRTYIDTNQYDVQIIPTPKAYHIFDNFRFKFFYLQLVIDDYLLAIPRVLQLKKYNGIFNFIKQGIDYRYITTSEEFYAAESTRIVNIKSKSVLYFIQILETSHQFESQIFSDVFSKLKELGIEFPNFHNIREDIKKELRGLNDRIKFSTDLENSFQEIDTDCTEIHNSMEECYTKSMGDRYKSKKNP